jgi:hypothetical protein
VGSGSLHEDSSGAGTRLGFDLNFHILPERQEKTHPALDRNAFQFVMQQCGDLG